METVHVTADQEKRPGRPLQGPGYDLQRTSHSERLHPPPRPTGSQTALHSWHPVCVTWLVGDVSDSDLSSCGPVEFSVVFFDSLPSYQPAVSGVILFTFLPTCSEWCYPLSLPTSLQ